MKELRDLFQKAASKQWFPGTATMTEVIERMSDSDGDIPASQIVNIDLETDIVSKAVLQVGNVDLEGQKVVDCLTKLAETEPSSSTLSSLTAYRQMKHMKRVRGYFTEDGTLTAKKVVGKLQESGIDNGTIFLSWASWSFDLSHLRAWLETEGFDGVLPGDGKLCLLLKEFRSNVKRVIGTTCFRGRRFPLSLSVVFLLLFGETHPLADRNHHALVDAKQLALMAKIFVDLCKPPGKRVHWSGTEVKGLGSGKRQRALEDYFSSTRPKSKARLS